MITLTLAPVLLFERERERERKRLKVSSFFRAALFLLLKLRAYCYRIVLK